MTRRARRTFLFSTTLLCAALIGCSSSSAVRWETPALKNAVDVRAVPMQEGDGMVEFEFTNQTSEHLSFSYRVDGTATPSDAPERWFRITLPPRESARVQHRTERGDAGQVILRQG